MSTCSGQGAIKGRRQKFRLQHCGRAFRPAIPARLAYYRRMTGADGFIRKHDAVPPNRQRIHDDCGHIGKVGTVQRHYVSVGGEMGMSSLLAAIFIDFISANTRFE